MSENEQDKQDNANQGEGPPAQSEERAIDLSEERKGIDVRPVSDAQEVSAPPMGGLAPVDATPAGEQVGGEGQPSAEQGLGGGSDGEE